MLLFDLVSVFFHVAALRTFGYVCVLCSLGALIRIFNILVRLFIVSPLWFVVLFCVPCCPLGALLRNILGLVFSSTHV